MICILLRSDSNVNGGHVSVELCQQICVSILLLSICFVCLKNPRIDLLLLPLTPCELCIFKSQTIWPGYLPLGRVRCGFLPRRPYGCCVFLLTCRVTCIFCLSHCVARLFLTLHYVWCARFGLACCGMCAFSASHRVFCLSRCVSCVFLTRMTCDLRIFTHITRNLRVFRHA
jgi:hypothetical protein